MSKPLWWTEDGRFALDGKRVYTALQAFIAIGVLFYAAIRFEGDKQVHLLNVVTLMSSLTVGWLLGFVASPYSSKEKEQFSNLAKLTSVFFTGYLAAKLSGMIDSLLSADHLRSPLYVLRALIFVTGVLVGAILTYVNRSYADSK